MAKYNRVDTSTRIRTFYNGGSSSLVLSFYNTNLSFRLTPVLSENTVGYVHFDNKNGLTTTANYTGASAIYIAANDIIDGKRGSDGMVLTIPGHGGALLILERRPNANIGAAEPMETFLVITKNNITIPFKFSTHPCLVKENSQMVTKYVESGLGVFAKTVEGYLIGVGADANLRKLPENFNELEAEKNKCPICNG